MPRRVLRNNHHEQSFHFAMTDFSIYDDCPASRTRFKSTASILTCLGKTLMAEQTWDEKELSDFEDDELERALVERKSGSYVVEKASTSGHRFKRHEYPMDLWFLIARYIAPEDVGRFSQICRATRSVVNTNIFWLRLFRKYDKLGARKFGRLLLREDLPIVRTYVIRSLYRTYPLFKARADKTAAIHKDPHFLVSSRCIRIWNSTRETTRVLYDYYFEFRLDKTHTIEPDTASQARSPVLQADHSCPIDKGSCILHLVCSESVAVGPYMGMILSQLTLNISSDYRHHKLKMCFTPSRNSLDKGKCSTFTMTFDPLLCLKVYHWYNSPANFD